jgi:hypothetical protein
MDTNVVERAIRPHTLTRKNALFAGSDGGACHWAMVWRSSSTGLTGRFRVLSRDPVSVVIGDKPRAASREVACNAPR